MKYIFYLGWKISFEQVQIQSMTMILTSSTLQIWRYEYSGDMNIVILVIFVGIGTLPFYAINMDIVSLFTDSSFSFLANLDLYCINGLYQFEWMNIIYFGQKKAHIHDTTQIRYDIDMSIRENFKIQDTIRSRYFNIKLNFNHKLKLKIQTMY